MAKLWCQSIGHLFDFCSPVSPEHGCQLFGLALGRYFPTVACTPNWHVAAPAPGRAWSVGPCRLSVCKGRAVFVAAVGNTPAEKREAPGRRCSRKKNFAPHCDGRWLGTFCNPNSEAHNAAPFYCLVWSSRNGSFSCLFAAAFLLGAGGGFLIPPLHPARGGNGRPGWSRGAAPSCIPGPLPASLLSSTRRPPLSFRTSLLQSFSTCLLAFRTTFSSPRPL
ncbi:hypothetical protein GQ54DRAFT_6440 [Martensiomyces pterosporus]|nr:hypothetical protein GQ54DRAFT_6440 [Martensiomyces pterosporus]